MKFLVHLGLPPFIKGLTKGCVVYIASYALVNDNKNAFVVLTSDLGVPNGVIHAVRITITDSPEHRVPLDLAERPDLSTEERQPIALAAQARKQIEEFLISKDLKVRSGAVLLTMGLEEALEFWNTLGYNLKELTDLLEGGKDLALNE